MARSATVHRVYLLLFRDEKLLFVRFPGQDKFRLPSLVGAKKPSPDDALYAASYFGAELDYFKKFHSHDFLVDGVRYRCAIEALDCSVDALGAKAEVLFLETSDPRLEEVDPVSLALANHAYLYAPLYLGQKRTVPFLKARRERNARLVKVLNFFARRGKMPGYVVSDFIGLIESPASATRIEKAYARICKNHSLDPHEYSRHKRYLRTRRKELR